MTGRGAGLLDFLISVAVQSGVWYNLNIVVDGLSIIMPQTGVCDDTGRI